MWWMTRTNGLLIEFSALAWVTFTQQNPDPPQSILDNPVTLAALLSLLAGALIHFIPRIAAAIVKVIEALAGIADEYYRSLKVRTDAMAQESAEKKSTFDQYMSQIKIERDRADAANDKMDKAIDASLESLRVANAATAQVTVLVTEKQKETEARLAAEKALEDERKRVHILELQLAAVSAWNANVVAIAKVEAEVKQEAERKEEAS